jgi:hypothetical protein
MMEKLGTKSLADPFFRQANQGPNHIQRIAVLSLHDGEQPAPSQQLLREDLLVRFLTHRYKQHPKQTW